MSKLPSQSITIYDGDDHQRLAELQATVAQAHRNHELAKLSGTRRVGDDTSPAAATAALEAFITEAAERAEEIVVNAIGRTDFRELRLAHPPRKVTETVDGEDVEVTHPEDAEPWNVNTETFPLALLMFVDPEDSTIRTITTPALEQAALRRYLTKELTEGQFDQAWTTAFYLNTTSAPDPKAFLNSVSRLASSGSSA